MSLFRNIGRRVERLKREVDDAAEEAASFECEDCGHRLHADRDECPECGSDDIVELN